MNIFEVAGIIGFFAYMGSYSLLQFGIIRGDSITYAAMNLVAALLIMISLSHSFNLGSALIQTTWITLSVIGICRTLHNQSLSNSSRSSGEPRRRSKTRDANSTRQAGHHPTKIPARALNRTTRSDNHTYRPRRMAS